MTSAPLAVVCPRCAGGSAIDPEYASLPAWACPFCAAVNPMHPAPTPVAADRSKRIAIAAAAVLGATIAISIALQAAHPRPPHRTIVGIVEALRASGLECRDLRTRAARPPVREEGSCSLGSGPVLIRTYWDVRRRDQTLGRLAPGHHAAGETWIVTGADAATVSAVAAVLDGVVLVEE
ncbi:MAG: hypothetical protein ACRDJM_09840 [Actinomycetota bacterium]